MVSLNKIVLAVSLTLIGVHASIPRPKPTSTSLSTSAAKPTTTKTKTKTNTRTKTRTTTSATPTYIPTVCGIAGYASQGGVDGSQYEMPWFPGQSEQDCRDGCDELSECRIVAFAPPWCFPWSANAILVGFGKDEGSTYIWWERDCGNA